MNKKQATYDYHSILERVIAQRNSIGGERNNSQKASSSAKNNTINQFLEKQASQKQLFKKNVAKKNKENAQQVFDFKKDKLQFTFASEAAKAKPKSAKLDKLHIPPLSLVGSPTTGPWTRS